MNHDSHPRRRQILAVLCLSLLVLGIDNLIVQVAIPSIQSDLHASSTELLWIVNSYILAFAGLLGLSGGLVDRFGHRRALLIGYLVFGVASVGAALSDGPGTLIAFRALMGAGGSLFMPATLAIIRDVFPAKERAQAIGIWAAMAVLGIPLGPVVGGLLLEHYDWGSIFLVNVPIVLVALTAGWLLIPRRAAAEHTRLDLPGVALSILGLVALVWAIIEAPERGHTDPTVLAAFAGSVLCFIAFWYVEQRAAEPLLPPELVRSRAFAGPMIAILIFASGLFGSVYLLTQYFQFVLGHDPLPAGLRLLAVATIAIGAPIGAAVSARIGPRWPVTAGMICMAAGLVIGSGADADSEHLAVLALAVIGPGMGLVMASSASAILAIVPEGKGGIGSAATETALELGGALGIAVMGSIVAGAYSNDMSPVADELPAEAAGPVEDSIGGAVAAADRIGDPAADQLLIAARDAFGAGAERAMLIAAGIALLGAALAAMMIPGRGRDDHGRPEPVRAAARDTA